MCLTLQMSLHMQQIRSSFMRVSGVDEDMTTSQLQESIRHSFGIVDKGHLLNFNELSESFEEEVEYNPWRESVLEDEGILSEGKLRSAHMSMRNSLDVNNEEELSDTEEASTVQAKPKFQLSRKWIPADVLFKKVLSLYDSIHNQTLYHVTNSNDTVVVNECCVWCVDGWASSL